MAVPRKYTMKTRPVMLLRAHGQRPDGRAGKGRARREKFLALSDEMAAARLAEIMEREQRRARAALASGEDCRERYLSWLRSGPDQRYYPLAPWGQSDS